MPLSASMPSSTSPGPISPPAARGRRSVIFVLIGLLLGASLGLGASYWLTEPTHVENERLAARVSDLELKIAEMNRTTTWETPQTYGLKVRSILAGIGVTVADADAALKAYSSNSTTLQEMNATLATSTRQIGVAIQEIASIRPPEGYETLHYRLMRALFNLQAGYQIVAISLSIYLPRDPQSAVGIIQVGAGFIAVGQEDFREILRIVA